MADPSSGALKSSTSPTKLLQVDQFPPPLVTFPWLSSTIIGLEVLKRDGCSPGLGRKGAASPSLIAPRESAGGESWESSMLSRC